MSRVDAPRRAPASTIPPEPTVQGPHVAAFASLYDAHVDEIYRFVHRRCRDRQLAEDLTQETFVRAIRSTDDPTSLSIGWLITVARNLLYDVLRRDTTREAKHRLIDAEDRSRTDTAAAEVTLVERLRVEAALEQLSVDHRLVLTLHYLDGLTVPAMADQLGRSVKSCEGMVTRARRALRTILEAEASAADGGDHDGR
ncbi:MAG: sigma-70 family RNA polymerase sigma factor [Actinomycetota bacterium]